MEILKQKSNICLGKIEISIGDIDHVTNSYVVYDKDNMDSSILFDPADKAEHIVKELDKNEISINTIFITHCHGDHTNALEDIYNIYKLRGIELKVYVHENDLDGLDNDNKNYNSMIGLKEIHLDEITITNVKCREIIKEGNIEIEVIHTPGHTDGSAIFLVKNLNILITGDTIFSNCYGRVDLESGNIKDMSESIDKIFDRFDNIEIYPGHGESAVLANIKKSIRMLLSIKK